MIVLETTGSHSKRWAYVRNGGLVLETMGSRLKWWVAFKTAGLHSKLQHPFQGLAYTGQRDEVAAVAAFAFVLAVDVFWIR
jgi:hypothetical protein